jgi:membrane protein DedA with SNARE-associated domain
MNGLEGFLRTYGLWGMFFAAAFEGDVTLLLAGMLVHLAVWSPAQALVAGAAGAFAGDTLYFWLGHGAARRWLASHRCRRVLDQVERVAQRFGVWSLVFARYIYGARVATMFYWGARGLAYRRFLLLDSLNCVIWAVLYGSLGFLFSSSLQWLVGELQRIEVGLLVGGVVFATLLTLRRYLLRRFRQLKDSH